MIIVLAAIAPGVAAEEPPVFDGSQRAAIEAMEPMTQTPAPNLAGKIVVVTFFASWCPPCTAEFRELNDLRGRLPAERVEIVALNIYENHFKKNREARLARFIDRTAPRFALLTGEPDAALSARFDGVERIPTVFVFDAEGALVTRFIHERGAEKTHANADELEAAIRPILEGK